MAESRLPSTGWKQYAHLRPVSRRAIVRRMNQEKRKAADARLTGPGSGAWPWFLHLASR